jgi:hypothetical protein
MRIRLGALLLVIGVPVHTVAGADRCKLGGVLVPLATVREQVKPAPPSSLKSGLVVRSVDDDGFLDRNGIRAGDIIAQIRAKTVDSNDEFLRWYESAPIDQRQRLVYWHVPRGQSAYRRMFVDAMVSAAESDVGISAYDGLDAALKSSFIEKWRAAIAEKHAKIDEIDDRLTELQLQLLQKTPGKSTHRRSTSPGSPQPTSGKASSSPTEELKALSTRVLDLRKELRALWHNDPPFVPVLPDFNKGRIGQLAVCGVVFQKLSERQSLIIKIGNDHLDDFVLVEDSELTPWQHRGKILKNADGLVYVNLPDTLEVTGTFSYHNPAGKIITVPSLREFKWPHHRSATAPAVNPEQRPLPEGAAKSNARLADRVERNGNASAAAPSADQDVAARKRFAGVLANARKLAKAGLRDAAEKNLKRIIKEAPGTGIAKEAQQELDQFANGG